MSWNAFVGILYIVIAVAIYFLPSEIASRRKHSSLGGIVILNLLLGWTVLGWIIALIWACSGDHSTGARPPEPDERVCPYCAEKIKLEAVVCKHCGRDIPPAASARTSRIDDDLRRMAGVKWPE